MNEVIRFMCLLGVNNIYKEQCRLIENAFWDHLQTDVIFEKHRLIYER